MHVCTVHVAILLHKDMLLKTINSVSSNNHVINKKVCSNIIQLMTYIFKNQNNVYITAIYINSNLQDLDVYFNLFSVDSLHFVLCIAPKAMLGIHSSQ